jgi:epoxyqueuosine reductase
VNSIQELAGPAISFLGMVDGPGFGGSGGMSSIRVAAGFDAWLADGCHAGMDWLARHRESRLAPGKVLEGARAVLVFAMPWAPAGTVGGAATDRRSPSGSIAGYAIGRDYHVRFRKELTKFLAALQRAFPDDTHRLLVDANPLAERHFACLTATGHIGRNTMFIHRELGSRIFLATLLTTVAPADFRDRFRVDDPGGSVPPACPAACRRCIDACPTGALTEAESSGRLDARLCLSYHSIESDEGIPVALRPSMGLRLFGCTACVDACPLAGPPSECRMDLATALSIGSHEDFCREFAGTAVMRAGWRQFRRCACVAAGNSGALGLAAELEALGAGPDNVTAEHAGWALRRLWR